MRQASSNDQRSGSAPSSQGNSTLKFLVVGNSNTGKSCLTLRFVEETFTQNFVPTIGIDFHVKNLDVDGRKVRLQIWDTAGQERFHNVTRTYFRGASAVLLVYDICDRESFDWLVKWRDQVVEYAGDVSSVVIAVVGNKCDRNEERQVTEEEGRLTAQTLGVHLFFETSAKSGKNVNELFEAVAREAVKKIPVTKPSAADDGNITLQQTSNKGNQVDQCAGMCGGGSSTKSTVV